MATVLIVDDSSFMRKKIAQAVEKAGHKVVAQAIDGLDGFEQYKRITPDVVVMDVTMRGADGIEGARLIKEYDDGAKIIFMSLLSDPEVEKKAMALGAKAFLKKDEYDRLIEIIGQ